MGLAPQPAARRGYSELATAIGILPKPNQGVGWKGASMDTSYRFGIEEKFFLADARTRGTPRRTAKAFHADVHAQLPAVERELLEAQVEIASPPCTSVGRRGRLALAHFWCTRSPDRARSVPVLIHPSKPSVEQKRVSCRP